MAKQKVENETKNERFKRLATRRTNDVLHRLKVLSNCSNRQLYSYEKKDIDKIFFEIEKKLREAKARFSAPRNNDKFSL